jgi:hypothetical protein
MTKTGFRLLPYLKAKNGSSETNDFNDLENREIEEYTPAGYGIAETGRRSIEISRSQSAWTAPRHGQA